MKSPKAKASGKQLSIYISSAKPLKDSATIRAEIVAYALQFIGNPYKWGGISLTKGADCSGFTQSVFKDHGICIPRTSKAQAEVGQNVSLDSRKPGDLIFYKKFGTIYHVALYIGNDKVISVGSPRTGIRIKEYNYRKPYKAVNYID